MAKRRYDLDWLRALTVLVLIFFHTGMLFNEWAWHIKNAQVSVGITIFNAFVGQYQMPLLFMISGAGSWFALGFRSGRQYLGERVRRLLVPLVFGTLFIVPPQIYLERISPPHPYSYGLSPLGRFHGSYLQFWPRHMFDGGTYPAGNFSWHHLWFLAYLFVFSLLAVPLFTWLRSPRGQARVAALAACCQRPGRLFLLALPLIAIEALLRPIWHGEQNLINDWANFALYFTCFAYGYLVFSHQGFDRALARHGWPALGLGVATFLGAAALALTDHAPGLGYSLPSLLWTALHVFNSWCWILAWFFLAQRLLNFTHRALPYVNEAVLPVYVLHQTVIVIIGFYLIQWPLPVAAKFPLVGLAALATTLLVYDLLVRRLGPLRFLFGMKAKRPA